MNLQCYPPLEPLKVLIVNPISTCGQLLTMKILSGLLFGTYQKIDVVLLVYPNEISSAKAFIVQLENCAFDCTNTINICCHLPCIMDADIFCFITKFPNPNYIDVDRIENDVFDSLCLMIRIANNLNKVTEEELVPIPTSSSKKYKDKPKERSKPIIMTDGLITLHLIKSICTNIPTDVLYCPTSLATIAKSILGDWLKVQCDIINNVLVWAANEEVFHIEFEKPLIFEDELNKTKCKWDMISKDLLKSLNVDHAQFNESWLKKEFLKKVKFSAASNPHGDIYKATAIGNALKTIWQARCNNGGNVYCNMGVISDGSCGTYKDVPYILPIIFSGSSWSVNKDYERESHVMQEISRINNTAKSLHEKLSAFWKDFLEKNVTNTFISEQGSDTEFFEYHSSSSQ